MFVHLVARGGTSFPLTFLLLNEDFSREKILECFKETIAKDELLKHSTDERLGDDGFLTRFLRAGCWRVEAALPILKTYSSLGQEYECYVSRAIPTRFIKKKI